MAQEDIIVIAWGWATLTTGPWRTTCPCCVFEIGPRRVTEPGAGALDALGGCTTLTPPADVTVTADETGMLIGCTVMFDPAGAIGLTWIGPEGPLNRVGPGRTPLGITFGRGFPSFVRMVTPAGLIATGGCCW